MRTFTGVAALLCLSLPAAAYAELRAYDVDAKYRQEVYEALLGILETPPPTGRVERLPTGQLLVDTSPEVQKQIEAILKQVAAHNATAAPQVKLRYWAVLGTPNTDDAAGMPAMLHDVLDEIEAVHGALGFRVLGNATLITESGQMGGLEGYPLSVRQQTYAQGNALNAEIEITFEYRRYVNPGRSDGTAKAMQPVQSDRQRVALKTTLEAGDVVVLGENTIDGAELDGTMFYIVNWPAER